MTLKLEDYKMVEDENTAYDEVIHDIHDIGYDFIQKDHKALKLFRQKCAQLMRLLDDDDSDFKV